MRLVITIIMGDQRSDGWKHDEAARLLRLAADKIEAGAWTHEICDNGDSGLFAEASGGDK